MNVYDNVVIAWWRETQFAEHEVLRRFKHDGQGVHCHWCFESLP
jgi:hypothetical protein